MSNPAITSQGSSHGMIQVGHHILVLKFASRSLHTKKGKKEKKLLLLKLSLTYF